MVSEKKNSIHWSEFAEKNLRDIFDYISADSHFHAHKTISSIIALSKKLSDSPLKFEECVELKTVNKIYRKATFTPYQLIYRIKKERIEILSVFHSSQNPKKIKSFRKIKVR